MQLCTNVLICFQKKYQKCLKLPKSLVSKRNRAPPVRSLHLPEKVVFLLMLLRSSWKCFSFVDFKKLHEAHFNKMESIDSYVQRRTRNLETYKDTAKDSKVKPILSFKKNMLFVLNLSLN